MRHPFYGSPRKSLVSTGLSRSERRIQPQIATFLGAKRSHQRLSRRALFIHRDEDGATIGRRESEIRKAVGDATLPVTVAPLAVIPVQMTEAWLLIDEQAIRKAAGFKNGTMPLLLPTPSEIERRADPKLILRDVLRVASGQRGRKLSGLNLNEARSMIANLVEDLGRLRALPSFRHFEESVVVTARAMQESG